MLKHSFSHEHQRQHVVSTTSPARDAGVAAWMPVRRMHQHMTSSSTCLTLPCSLQLPVTVALSADIADIDMLTLAGERQPEAHSLVRHIARVC